MIRSCAVCGGSFRAAPYRIARGRGRYCSQPCAYAARRKPPVISAAAQVVTCPGCGEVCLLVPLARGGGDRLVDQEGDAHDCPQIDKRPLGMNRAGYVDHIACRKEVPHWVNS